MGIVKMKALARSYVWWPHIDQNLENVTKPCESCLKTSANPPRAELHVWQWPEGPSQRIHVDFCGPVLGKMYIILTDAYSKWIDIRSLPNITADTTITILRKYFATWGLPNILVNDNGPTFTLEAFQKFLKSNHVRHV